MNRCKTCRWWTLHDGDGRTDHWNEILRPVDQDTYDLMEMPFEVRYCTNPKQTFCERPVISDGFALQDGSGYRASIYTAEDFGCVLWEDAEDLST